MNKNPQREAFEAFVRSGKSPVPPSEIEKPLADGSYRTSAANAGWVFWQAAQATDHLEDVHADAPDLDRCKDLLSQKVSMMHMVIGSNEKAASLLDKILPIDQRALQAWMEQQTSGDSGSIDVMRWPGWGEAVQAKIQIKD